VVVGKQHCVAQSVDGAFKEDRAAVVGFGVTEPKAFASALGKTGETAGAQGTTNMGAELLQILLQALNV